MNNSIDQRIIVPPEDYPSEVAGWVWMLADARQRTEQSLAGLSDEAINQRPPGGGNSIAMLLYHLAAIEMSYLYEDMLGVGWAPELDALLSYNVRDDEGQLAEVGEESLANHLARLDATRALTLRVVRGLAAGELRRARAVGEPGQPVRYVITPEWILHHILQHEAEHRGQIGMLRG
jgi:uncharacterized damage-inducible protein DinB